MTPILTNDIRPVYGHYWVDVDGHVYSTARRSVRLMSSWGAGRRRDFAQIEIAGRKAYVHVLVHDAFFAQ